MHGHETVVDPNAQPFDAVKRLELYTADPARNLGDENSEERTHK